MSQQLALESHPSSHERIGSRPFRVTALHPSDLSLAERLAEAHRRVCADRLNAVVVIDAEEEATHGVIIVTPEGGEISLRGFEDEVKKELATFFHRRSHVQWTKSVCGGEVPSQTNEYEPLGQLTLLLDVAHRAHLFNGTNGNMSWRGSQENTLHVSPRQVRKDEMKVSDFLLVQSRSDVRELVYFGSRKPSIDSSVQAELYRRLPHIHGFLHVHADAGIVFADAATTFPYPCGALEEADEVTRAIGETEHGDAPFCVELIHHGFLVGLERNGAERIAREWRRAVDAYHAHLYEIGQTTDAIASLVLQPIFVSASIAGVIATHREEKWVSCFLLPERRGGGNGRRLLEALRSRGVLVKAHDRCHVAEFYLSHGWSEVSREGQTTLLAPT